MDAFGFTWESTSNRIGDRAVLRSDVGLSLDEIGIGDQRAIATAGAVAGRPIAIRFVDDRTIDQ